MPNSTLPYTGRCYYCDAPLTTENTEARYCNAAHRTRYVRLTRRQAPRKIARATEHKLTREQLAANIERIVERAKANGTFAWGMTVDEYEMARA